MQAQAVTLHSASTGRKSRPGLFKARPSLGARQRGGGGTASLILRLVEIVVGEVRQADCFVSWYDSAAYACSRGQVPRLVVASYGVMSSAWPSVASV